MRNRSKKSPWILRFLAIVLVLFALGALWGGLTLYGTGSVLAAPEGVNIGLPVADILVNAPASLLTAVGLWGLFSWGVVMAWFTAGFYLYASVEIFAHYLVEGPPYDPAIFLPQALAILVAFALLITSWLYRHLFVESAPEVPVQAVGEP